MRTLMKSPKIYGNVDGTASVGECLKIYTAPECLFAEPCISNYCYSLQSSKHFEY